MLLRLAIFAVALLIPALALADADHSGLTLAVVDGQERWLDQDELAGYRNYVVKFHAYSGDQVVGQAEVSVCKGFVSHAESTTGHGEILADGGFRSTTQVHSLVVVEDPSQRGGLSRSEYAAMHDMDTSSLAPFEPLLPRIQKFSFGSLDVYVYNDAGERCELELYRADFPGYDLQPVPDGLPIATLRGEPTPKLIGTYSGVLEQSATPLNVELPESPFPPFRDSSGQMFKPTWGGFEPVPSENN